MHEGSRDNWAHRSVGMHCATCIFFVQKHSIAGEAELAGDHRTARNNIGRCRRHAPSQVVLGWPVVYASDWCGDYKKDEEK